MWFKLPWNLTQVKLVVKKKDVSELLQTLICSWKWEPRLLHQQGRWPRPVSSTAPAPRWPGSPTDNLLAGPGTHLSTLAWSSTRPSSSMKGREARYWMDQLFQIYFQFYPFNCNYNLNSRRDVQIVQMYDVNHQGLRKPDSKDLKKPRRKEVMLDYLIQQFTNLLYISPLRTFVHSSHSVYFYYHFR